MGPCTLPGQFLNEKKNKFLLFNVTLLMETTCMTIWKKGMESAAFYNYSCWLLQTLSIIAMLHVSGEGYNYIVSYISTL